MAAYDSVEQARVLQFKANVTHLYQQTGAKLRGTFREETLAGKAHFFERLGTEAAVLKSARHADTVLLDPAHTRRMVVPADYVWNALVDQQDKIRLLIDPNSEYAIAAANALKRAQDDAYIAAFTADAATGESGGTAVTFAADSAAGDVDVSAAAVTTVNILAIKKALDNGDVPAEERYAAVMPSVITQLLANTTAPIAASSDYNTIKALVMGELDTWCGFKWITTTRCPLAAVTDYFTFFWQKQSMGAAIAKEIMARLSERADKDYATQSYACMTIGATRIQGPGVYRLRIDNAL
jgi:hypothetical protein